MTQTTLGGYENGADDEPAERTDAGFESIGLCKHGDEVASADRTTEDRDPDQQGFEAFSDTETHQ